MEDTAEDTVVVMAVMVVMAAMEAMVMAVMADTADTAEVMDGTITAVGFRVIEPPIIFNTICKLYHIY